MSGTFELELAPLRLECGGVVKPHHLRGWDGGGDGPVVLVVHALTGDARVDQWWSGVVGPGRALDPARWRILCFNNLGSCYGSAGPLDPGFPTRAAQPATIAAGYEGLGRFDSPPPGHPAIVTTWDLARSLLAALDALGIPRVHLVTGGSLGAMVCLCLSALAPDRVERQAPVAGCMRADPWIVGWNHVARQILALDEAHGGDGTRSLAVARQLAMLTYRAGPGLARHHDGRHDAVGCGDELETGRPFRVQTWLEHQGRKLVARFDRRAYLVQLDAMDHHDLARFPGAPQGGERWAGTASRWGVDRIRASTLAIGISSDQLFAPQRSQELVSALRGRGVHAEYAELESPYGHDAFLIEWSQLDALLRRALALPGELRD